VDGSRVEEILAGQIEEVAPVLRERRAEGCEAVGIREETAENQSAASATRTGSSTSFNSRRSQIVYSKSSFAILGLATYQ
jgi:hypothetical protein